jgi:hypothetical protein
MWLLVGTTFYPVISMTKRHKLIMWGFRLAAIPLAIILYVVLARNFYTSDPYAGKPARPGYSYILMTLALKRALGVDTYRASPGLVTTIVKGMYLTRFVRVCHFHVLPIYRTGITSSGGGSI